jgi:Fe-S cluster assembly protein SufD
VAWVEEHGLPTRKDEDWRYTTLDALAAVLVGTPEASASEELTIALGEVALPMPAAAARFVVSNGHVVPALSEKGRLPEGVRIESLAGALRWSDPLVEDFWARPAKGYQHAFRALNDAFALDGVLIDLAAGIEVATPIELVFVSVPAKVPRWSHPRVVVLAGAASKLTLVETYVGGEGLAVTNALTQVKLDPNAEVVHYVLQDESRQSDHFSRLEALLGQDSRLTTRLVATGSRIGRHEVDVLLAGKGATVSADGLFFAGVGQCQDNPVRIDHVATRATSRQLYKGVVSGDGRGVFNGHVVVHPGAEGTDAAQVNKNLLLSKQAEVDTRPRLEIYADDVACSHGAAVGELDADALFYLRSRGIDETLARAILVSGFAEELLERFEHEAVRERASKLIGAAGLLGPSEQTLALRGRADPATRRAFGLR